MSNQPTIEDLASELQGAKAQESAARQRRIEIESAILAHPSVVDILRDEGTTTVGPVKVTTGYSRSWDQEQLEAERPDILPAYWPFRMEWKEDLKASQVLAERFPDLWDALRHALTLKPKKPSVSVVEQKRETA